MTSSLRPSMCPVRQPCVCKILKKKFANSGLCRLVLLAADIEAKVQRVDEADEVEDAVVDAVEDAGDMVETETSKNDVVFAVAALII